jgi:hypothetical protein
MADQRIWLTILGDAPVRRYDPIRITSALAQHTSRNRADAAGHSSLTVTFARVDHLDRKSAAPNLDE